VLCGPRARGAQDDGRWGIAGPRRLNVLYVTSQRTRARARAPATRGGLSFFVPTPWFVVPTVGEATHRGVGQRLNGPRIRSRPETMRVLPPLSFGGNCGQPTKHTPRWVTTTKPIQEHARPAFLGNLGKKCGNTLATKLPSASPDGRSRK